jgi:thiamine transport system substrate-binding protein
MNGSSHPPTVRGLLRSMFLGGALLLAACTPSATGPSPSPSAAGPASPSPASSSAAAAPVSLVLMTHDAFAIDQPILDAFEQQHIVNLQVLKSGDAGSMVNQAILTRSAPLADVLYGVDNTFLSRALDAGIFEPYTANGLAQVPAALQMDPQHRVTPIDYGDVCPVFDKSAYDAGTPPPATLEDLTQPAYHSQLVVENPATSSPGLAFLLATIAHFGETGSYTWQDYWRDLRANDVSVENDWETAYYNSFSGSSGGGDRPIVVSYATDPAAEVYFASPQPTQAPIAVLTDGCFRQVEFAGVLAGTQHPDLAHALIDYMLSPAFQSDIPLNMFVFPANGQAQVPAIFNEFAAHVSDPIEMDPAQISANRDRWIQEWTDVVIH